MGTTLPVQLRQLVKQRERCKSRQALDEETVAEINEKLKELVDVDSAVEVDGFRISHYRGRGQCEADAYEAELKQNPELREIEERYQRAKEVRDEARAEYSYATTCIRITKVAR